MCKTYMLILALTYYHYMLLQKVLIYFNNRNLEDCKMLNTHRPLWAMVLHVYDELLCNTEFVSGAYQLGIILAQ